MRPLQDSSRSKHGAKVVIADIQDNLGNSVCKDLESSSSASYICPLRCNKGKGHRKRCEHSRFQAWQTRYHVYNNAGITGVNKTSIVDNKKSEFEEVINVNLVGAFLGTKHAARVMIPAARRGSIYNYDS